MLRTVWNLRASCLAYPQPLNLNALVVGCVELEGFGLAYLQHLVSASGGCLSSMLDGFGTWWFGLWYLEVGCSQC